jgi:periplasmic protein TonB
MYLNSSWPRFFALSLAIHLFFFLLLFWPRQSVKTPATIPIPVALLPVPETIPEKPRVARKDIPRAVPKPAPTRPSKAPAIIAKKASPTLDNKPMAPRENLEAAEPKHDVPSPRDEIQEEPVIAERSLPTLRELLPPVGWSLAGQRSTSGNKPIPLNTSEPRYITYLGSIQRSIYANWQYPELALHYGLHGRVIVEFTILENGRVEGIRLVRSSGSILLDDEALRAIKAAAPFSPIPPWIEPKPLLISAGMEYHDGRLNTRPSP